MMFQAIWIAGLLCFIVGFSGIQIPGITKGEFLLAGGFLEAIIIVSVIMSFKGGRRGGKGIDPRFLQGMMQQEKADRSEERRAFQSQQNMLMELLREQGKQQTEAINAIANMSKHALSTQATNHQQSLAALSVSNQQLIAAGSRLDYDERIESYVARLKNSQRVVVVEDGQAEAWAELAPNQVNPKLLTGGE
jgi:hypothetical protein